MKKITFNVSDENYQKLIPYLLAFSNEIEDNFDIEIEEATAKAAN